MLSRKQLGCQNVLTIVPCTSAIRALPVFSVGHHPAHNFLVKCTCCHFAQVIGVTLDPKNTFPYLLKNRASTRVRLPDIGDLPTALARLSDLTSRVLPAAVEWAQTYTMARSPREAAFWF